MAGFADLSDYTNDTERNAVCAELARMLRIVPLSTLAVPGEVCPRTEPGAASTFSGQGVIA